MTTASGAGAGLAHSDAATTAVHAVAEQAARTSYGRLLAFLSVRSRDIVSAEDALGDAFAAALEQWPVDGVPANPEAWLLTTARRRLVDAARRERVRDASIPALLHAAELAEERPASFEVLDDDRLKLLFVCAHPAIDPSVRTPLMLQTVMRLDAARIASVFCVSPAAMGRKLSRAKRRIQLAGIPFEIPESAEMPARLDAVLEAIYAAYGSGWDDVAGEDPRRSSLSREAILLGRLIVERLPGEPEALGLLALMLHCEARRSARRGPTGEFVPLERQDCTLWSRDQIDEAEDLLMRASEAGRIGRFQLEAAIQSAHAQRIVSGGTDWEAVALLYEGLVRLCPTLGARVGRAAAVARVRGADAGLALLDELPARGVESYQPFWTLSAHLLAAAGRRSEARWCLQRAIGLCDDEAVRAHLLKELALGCYT